MALGRSAEALGTALLLGAAAFVGESTIGARTLSGNLLFLASAAVGTAAGYRLAGTAFRQGRRRRGRDPAPAEGPARLVGGFIGFWIKLLAGFAFWALLLHFLR